MSTGAGFALDAFIQLRSPGASHKISSNLIKGSWVFRVMGLPVAQKPDLSKDLYIERP